MGYALKRPDRHGRTRYTAVYQDIRGERRSAGTYPTRKDADKAWQRAEARVTEGRAGDPAGAGRRSAATSSRSGCRTM